MKKEVKFIKNYSRLYERKKLKLFKISDLIGYCKQFKIKGYSDKKKDEIIDLIIKNQNIINKEKLEELNEQYEILKRREKNVNLWVKESGKRRDILQIKKEIEKELKDVKKKKEILKSNIIR